MRKLLLPALAVPMLLAVAAAPAQAQTTGVVMVVGAGDALDQRPLQVLNAALGFLDADNDGRADGKDPAEPVYLDLDSSRTVSYGDLRMTAHGRYPAGTSVDITNGDEGRTLAPPQGWFAKASAGHWLLDLDGNRAVSAGDVRLTPAFGGRVAGGDADAGQALDVAQQQIATSLRVGYVDVDANGVRGASEPIYLDLDPNGSPSQGRVSVGDLRLVPSGMSLDDAPTRAEFDEALAQAGVERGEDGYVADGASPWSAPVILALLLGVLNLLGLGFVLRRLRGPPTRNPGDPHP